MKNTIGAIRSHYGIVLLFFAMVVGKSGIWLMPNLLGQHNVSQSLERMPFTDPNAQYIYSNFLEPFLFGIIGLKSPIFYALYAGIISMLFLVLFIGWFITYHSEESAIAQQKVFLTALFPVFAVPFYWIGMDGMTLLLLLIMMININHAKPLFITAALLGMQHFEQGFLAFGFLIGSLILAIIFSPYSKAIHIKVIIQAGIGIAGLILGKVILMGYFYSAGIVFTIDRLAYTQNSLPVFMDQWSKSWPYILYSSLAIGWIIILSRIRLLWPFIITMLVALLMMILVGDQTRVMSIVTFPALFYWVLMNKDFWNNLNQRWIIPLLIVYFIAPFVYVWGGPFGDVWRFDFKVIQSILAGSFNIYSLDYLMPFKP